MLRHLTYLGSEQYILYLGKWLRLTIQCQKFELLSGLNFLREFVFRRFTLNGTRIEHETQF